MADDRNDIDKPLTMEDIQAKSEEFRQNILGVKILKDGRLLGENRNALELEVADHISTYWGMIFSIKGLDEKKIRPHGDPISKALANGIEFGRFPDSTSYIYHSDVKMPKLGTRIFHGKPSPLASDDIKGVYEQTFSPLVKIYDNGHKLTAGMLLPMIHASDAVEKGMSTWLGKNKDKLLDKILHSPAGKNLDPKLIDFMKHQIHTEMGAGVFSSLTATKEDINKDASTYTGSLSTGIEGQAAPFEIKLPDQFFSMDDKDDRKHRTPKSKNAALVGMFKNNLRKLYKNEIQEAKAALKTILDCAAGGATKTLQAIKASKSLPSLAVLGLEKLGKEGILEITASGRKAFVEKAEEAMKEAIDTEINERYSGRILEVEFIIGALTSATCTLDPEMVKNFEMPKILPPGVQDAVDGLKSTAKFINDTGEKLREGAHVAGEVLYDGVVTMDMGAYANDACGQVGAAMHSNDISQQCVDSVKAQIGDMPVVDKKAVDFSVRHFQATLPTTEITPDIIPNENEPDTSNSDQYDAEI